MIRLLLTAFVVSYAISANATTLKCDESHAIVEDSESVDNPFFTLNITNKRLNSSYRFSVERDFINLRCDHTADGTAVFLILHFCGGSGCTDNSNFGIIEALSGKILLEPNQPYKGNAADAKSIMGKDIEPFSCIRGNDEICLHTKLELG